MASQAFGDDQQEEGQDEADTVAEGNSAPQLRSWSGLSSGSSLHHAPAAPALSLTDEDVIQIPQQTAAASNKVAASNEAAAAASNNAAASNEAAAAASNKAAAASNKAAAASNKAAAAAADSDDSIDDESRCSVCFLQMVHPVRLPCNHVFCFLCVKGVAITSSRRCALCRQAIPAEFLLRPTLVNTTPSKQTAAYRARRDKLPPRGGDSDGGSQALDAASPCRGPLQGNQQEQLDYQWFYEGRNGWWQYDERTSKEIECSYGKSEESCQVMVAGLMFIVDFTRMLQYRVNDPTKRRRIKRDLNSIPIKGIAGISLRRLDGVDDEIESSREGVSGRGSNESGGGNVVGNTSGERIVGSGDELEDGAISIIGSGLLSLANRYLAPDYSVRQRTSMLTAAFQQSRVSNHSRRVLPAAIARTDQNGRGSERSVGARTRMTGVESSSGVCSLPNESYSALDNSDDVLYYGEPPNSTVPHHIVQCSNQPQVPNSALHERRPHSLSNGVPACDRQHWCHSHSCLSCLAAPRHCLCCHHVCGSVIPTAAVGDGERQRCCPHFDALPAASGDEVAAYHHIDCAVVLPSVGQTYRGNYAAELPPSSDRVQYHPNVSVGRGASRPDLATSVAVPSSSSYRGTAGVQSAHDARAPHYSGGIHSLQYPQDSTINVTDNSEGLVERSLHGVALSDSSICLPVSSICPQIEQLTLASYQGDSYLENSASNSGVGESGTSIIFQSPSNLDINESESDAASSSSFSLPYQL